MRGLALTHIGEYWAVNQILAKQLHTTDEGILNYTTNLMDKLEQVRRPWEKYHVTGLTEWRVDQGRVRGRRRRYR